MALKSVTKLSKALKEFGAAVQDFTARALKGSTKALMAEGYGIGNETYGRDSMVYVYTPDNATRKRLERFLAARGFKVCRDYWPGSGVAEVQVSYFKGHHWNE